MSEQWIIKKFCKYCDEEDEDCECEPHHIQAMKECGFGSYAAAEEAFEWEGYESDLKDWAYEIVNDTSDLSDLPSFVERHIDWHGVAQDLLNDYYTIEDEHTKGYIYLYRAV